MAFQSKIDLNLFCVAIVRATTIQVIVYIDTDVCASQVIQRFVGLCQDHEKSLLLLSIRR